MFLFMRHGRIYAFYQSQLTEMPDRWKKVLAIIKPIIYFRFAWTNPASIKGKVCASQYNIFSTVKIKDES